MIKKTIIILLFSIVIGGVGYLYQTVPQDSEIVYVSMIDNKGQEQGIVKLSETKAGVLLSLNISGLTPNGQHGFHVHQTGKCTPLDSFKNAGGHFNPDATTHGIMNGHDHHAGDMPNLLPNDKGVIKAHVLNKKTTLLPETSKDGRYSLFDADGSALIVHESADDHLSQPSGAAGKRILCGVIASKTQ